MSFEKFEQLRSKNDVFSTSQILEVTLWPYLYSLFLQNRFYFCKIGYILGNVLGLRQDFAKMATFCANWMRKWSAFGSLLILGEFGPFLAKSWGLAEKLVGHRVTSDESLKTLVLLARDQITVEESRKVINKWSTRLTLCRDRGGGPFEGFWIIQAVLLISRTNQHWSIMSEAICGASCMCHKQTPIPCTDKLQTRTKKWSIMSYRLLSSAAIWCLAGYVDCNTHGLRFFPPPQYGVWLDMAANSHEYYSEYGLGPWWAAHCKTAQHAVARWLCHKEWPCMHLT